MLKLYTKYRFIDICLLFFVNESWNSENLVVTLSHQD